MEVVCGARGVRKTGMVMNYRSFWGKLYSPSYHGRIHWEVCHAGAEFLHEFREAQCKKDWSKDIPLVHAAREITGAHRRWFPCEEKSCCIRAWAIQKIENGEQLWGVFCDASLNGRAVD